MKKVSGTLKLLYSQYRELQGFAQFGSDLDKDTKARLEQGARIVEVLKQNRGAPVAVELQVAIIYAVVNNLLHDIEISDIHRFEEELFEQLVAVNSDLIEKIRVSGVLDQTTEAELREAIVEFKNKFLGKE